MSSNRSCPCSDESSHDRAPLSACKRGQLKPYVVAILIVDALFKQASDESMFFVNVYWLWQVEPPKSTGTATLFELSIFATNSGIALPKGTLLQGSGVRSVPMPNPR